MAQISILDALDAAGSHPDCVPSPPTGCLDAWRPGDAVPPGLMPPVPGTSDRPWRDCVHGPGFDAQVAAEIWQAVHESLTPEIPFPFKAFAETTRLPDGAAWACLVAITDGGLSHVVLRDGVLEWSDAPGAGPIIWREHTHSWVRLPSNDRWDAEALAWVPKGSAPEAASAPPDVEAPAAASAETGGAVPPEGLARIEHQPDEPAPDAAAPVPVPAEPPLVLGGAAAFLHAINLATDVGWRAPADSLDRTTPEAVRQAVARRVLSGDLSLANADALLERVGLVVTPAPAEPAAEAEPAPEPEPTEDNARPVDRTRPVPPAPSDFMENLARVRAAAAVARAAEFCVGRALVETGLAEWAERGVKLLPPASDVVRIRWQAPMHAPPRHKLFLLDDAYAGSPVVRRVEEITRLRALPATRR